MFMRTLGSSLEINSHEINSCEINSPKINSNFLKGMPTARLEMAKKGLFLEMPADIRVEVVLEEPLQRVHPLL